MRDFTLAQYERLCGALADCGYAGIGIAEYLSRPQAERPARLVLLRHDVDRRAQAALQLGAIERQLALVGTYFYRTRRLAADRQAIEAMAALGHEIGYHYESVSDARGDLALASRLFARDLERLRDIAPVRVASMHGRPLLPWDNRDIWRVAQPADFGLLGEVYRDIDYEDVAYFSDTGRTWHPTRHNIRDRVAMPSRHRVSTTDELVRLVQAGSAPRLCILAHPERWRGGIGGWIVQWATDTAVNVLKLAAAGVYGRGRTRSEAGEK